MALSLQGPSDNPKDSDEWKIYPSQYENKKKEVGSGFEFEKCEIPTEHEVCLIYKITYFFASELQLYRFFSIPSD